VGPMICRSNEPSQPRYRGERAGFRGRPGGEEVALRELEPGRYVDFMDWSSWRSRPRMRLL